MASTNQVERWFYSNDKDGEYSFDAPLPFQISSSNSTPFHAFYRATLEEAWQCLRGVAVVTVSSGMEEQGAKRRRLASLIEAEQWVLGTHAHSAAMITFEQCCRAFGLNPKRARQELFKNRQIEPGLQRYVANRVYSPQTPHEIPWEYLEYGLPHKGTRHRCGCPQKDNRLIIRRNDHKIILCNACVAFSSSL